MIRMVSVERGFGIYQSSIWKNDCRFKIIVNQSWEIETWIKYNKYNHLSIFTEAYPTYQGVIITTDIKLQIIT